MVNMFGISFFGWSKASKCKKLIRKARSRIMIRQYRRRSMATELRRDLAELLQNGYHEAAVRRAEHLIQLESLVAAYGLLDQFLEYILKKLSYIQKQRECPPGINEAVSSLIFASARCGDFPELHAIRKLFEKRYGQELATSAVYLHPGNLVDKKLIEKLSLSDPVESVPDDLKCKVVDEIAMETSLQSKVEEESQGKECQLGENDEKSKETIAAGSKTDPSEVERDVTCRGLSMDEDESIGYKLSATTKRKCASKKRLRRRSALPERHGIMEIEYKMYYQKPHRGHSSSHTRQHLLERVSSPSSYRQKRLKQHASEKEKCIISCGQGSSEGESLFSLMVTHRGERE